MSAENTLDFSGMTRSEIAKLYQDTVKLAREQGLENVRSRATREFAGQVDFPDSEKVRLDGLGNVSHGPEPVKPKKRTVLDASNNIAELEEGEELPVSRLDVVSWVNSNLDDPRVKAAFPEELRQFEFTLDDKWVVRGDMNQAGWSVTAFADGEREIKFKLSPDLEREGASDEAKRYVQSQIAQRFPELTQQQLNMLSRLAASDRSHALILYIRSRLPEKLAQEFEWRLNSSEASGDVPYLLEFTSEPEVNAIVEEACFAVWMWSNPRASEAFEAYVDENRDRHPITFQLLDTLWQRFHVDKATHLTQQAESTPPTQEEIERLREADPEAFEKLRVAAIRERRKQRGY